MITNKIKHGQFFTMRNIFMELKPFQLWFKNCVQNPGTILEPFAGANNIPKMLPFFDWKSYDLEPADAEVIQRDTLKSFPVGYKTVITNPPYLAKNSATRKGIDTSAWKHDDLYKECLEVMLRHCDFVAAIVPETLLHSSFDLSRLHTFISLNKPLFDDTTAPVCLVLFTPWENKTFSIYSYNQYLFESDTLKAFQDKVRKASMPMTFNAKDGNLGLIAIDNTKAPSIRFVFGDKIDPKDVKGTSRHKTRILLPGVEITKELVDALNEYLTKLRQDSQDIFFSPFKGLRSDGFYRRRLSFAQARMIIEHVIEVK